MKNIFEELVKIEERATFVTKDAEEERERLLDEIEEFKTEISTRISKETKEKIRNFVSEATIESEKKIDEINIKTRKHLESMEKEYINEGNAWAEDIFNKIIRR